MQILCISTPMKYMYLLPMVGTLKSKDYCTSLKTLTYFCLDFQEWKHKLVHVINSALLFTQVL